VISVVPDNNVFILPGQFIFWLLCVFLWLVLIRCDKGYAVFMSYHNPVIYLSYWLCFIDRDVTMLGLSPLSNNVAASSNWDGNWSFFALLFWTSCCCNDIADAIVDCSVQLHAWQVTELVNYYGLLFVYVWRLIMICDYPDKCDENQFVEVFCQAPKMGLICLLLWTYIH